MRSFESLKMMSELQAEDPERDVLISNLVNLGEQTGNRLVFLEQGEVAPKKYKDVKSKFVEKLSPEDMILVRQLQESCHAYLRAPLFTDDFHKDNISRRKWEKNLDGMTAELLYYKNNRLGTNFNDSVFGMLRVLVETIPESDLRSNLAELLTLVPLAFSQREEDGGLLYDSLSDDMKIEVSHQVADLARKILERIESNKEEL